MPKEDVRYILGTQRGSSWVWKQREAAGVGWGGAGDPHGHPSVGEAGLASLGRGTREQGGHSEDRSD